MTNRYLYNEYVDVDEELDRHLKKCFVNHLIVYNYCLKLLYDNPELSFRIMKKQAVQYLQEQGIAPVLDVALFNELYYQHKKFKFNIRVQKLITDIQYFTFLLKDYNCKNFALTSDLSQIHFEDLSGVLRLTKPLPPLPAETVVYLNLSYSNAEDKYKISIYPSK